MTLRVYYSSTYAVASVPILARLGNSAAAIAKLPGVELVAPPPFKPNLLQDLHSPAYVNDFLSGTEPLASSQGIPWSVSVRDASLAMLSGQVEGAKHALQQGIAMNLARGFHHAVRDRGSGYCALNGLALVALLHADKRILVIDCDEHGGNGTEEFTTRLPNLFNISIFGTRFGCRGGERSWAFKVNVPQQGFDVFREVLDETESLLKAIQPHLVLYQAGADSHEDDPKGQTGLSSEQMLLRDDRVFRMARTHNVPILFNVAGGYQTADIVAQLNVNTVRAAQAAYGGNDSGTDAAGKA